MKKIKKEIDQTQILNLAEVQARSLEEKKEQKLKFIPFVIALIGVFAIGCGGVMMLVSSSSKDEDVAKDVISTKSHIGCTAKYVNDGKIASSISYSFEFEDKQLEKYTKTVVSKIVSVTEENRQTLTNLYNTALLKENYENQILGYQTKTEFNNDTVSTVIRVDLSKINSSNLTYTMEDGTIGTVEIEFLYHESLENIKLFMEQSGATCD